MTNEDDKISSAIRESSGFCCLLHPCSYHFTTNSLPYLPTSMTMSFSVFLCSGVLKGHLTYFRERDREKVYLKGINKVVEMEREIGRKDKTRDTAHPISFLSGAELWKSVWQALTPPGDVERAEWWLLNDFPRNLDRLLASPQFSCVLRTTPRPLWGSGLSVEMFPLGLMQTDLCFL